MENNKTTKLIAKQNLLKLEANYKYIKKLANMSSNDDNFNAHLTWSCQSFLAGGYWAYEQSLRPFDDEDYYGTYECNHIDGKAVWKHKCHGCIMPTYEISTIYQVYWYIKHNKLEEICKEPESTAYAVAEYLMDENTNIKNICSNEQTKNICK